MDQQRRFLMNTMAAGLAGGVPLLARTQGSYPSRPLTIVVPYPPGASSDLTARLVQHRMSSAFGQPVVVENRAGAGGAIGATFVARSPADGYRILMATQPIVTVNPHLIKDMGFDATEDLVPVSSAINAVVAICIHASLPVKSLAELIAYGRQNPGSLNFGTAGQGSPQHIGGILLNQASGLDMVHVPYKGGGPMLNDLLAGHVKVGIATLSVFKSLLEDPRVRVIAIGEKNRYAGTPAIPTIAETIPGFELNTWLGFFAPAGLPREVFASLSGAVEAALRAEDVRTKLSDSALLVQNGGPAGLARTVREDHQSYGRIIREHKITAE